MSEVKNKIVCPWCGREYMAAEVFYPDSLLGKPANIIKNEDGKIEYWSGDDMNLTETFVCDCGKEFATTANIKFETQKIVKNDFDEVYESRLYPEGRLILGEE